MPNTDRDKLVAMLRGIPSLDLNDGELGEYLRPVIPDLLLALLDCPPAPVITAGKFAAFEDGRAEAK